MHTVYIGNFSSGWLEGARYLIGAGADSNYRDREGWSAMYYASLCINNQQRRHDLLLLMLHCGANLSMEYWATDTNHGILYTGTFV